MLGKPFHYSLTILERHLDTFGHVNNARYLEILEEARWEMITQGGYGLEEIQRRGMGPVVTEIHARFLRELRLRERINVETRFISQRGRVGTFEQVIYNEAGKPCCEATVKGVIFDLGKRKVVQPPSSWLRAVGVQSLDSSVENFDSPQDP